MSPEEARRSQKPYRYGMILLCFGALINWVGLAENYTEPIRYAGVACIICGALLICTAMCCWLHSPPRRTDELGENGDPVHVITVPDHIQDEKPPEYETCVVHPPSYDDALQLSPAALLATAATTLTPDVGSQTNCEASCQSSHIPNMMTPSQLFHIPGERTSTARVVVSGMEHVLVGPSIMAAQSNRVAPLMTTINVCRVTISDK